MTNTEAVEQKTSPPFTRESVTRELDKSPPADAFSQAEQGGRGDFQHLRIGYVKARMREIFGWDGFSTTAQLMAYGVEQYEDEKELRNRTKKVTAFRAWAAVKVSVTIPLPWGGRLVLLDGVGTCAQEKDKTCAGAIKLAFKGAESDAFKRAVYGLGASLGLGLRLTEEEKRALEDDSLGAELPDTRPHRDDRSPRDDDGRERQRERESRRDNRDERPRDRDDHEEPRRTRDRDDDGEARSGDRDDRRDDRDDRGSRREERDRVQEREQLPNDPRDKDCDPDFQDLTQAGFDRRMAKTLATLPSRELAPRGACKDVFDLAAATLTGVDGLDAMDRAMSLFEVLKIDDRKVTGQELRRFAVAFMQEAKN